jgi:hypothetical protein
VHYICFATHVNILAFFIFSFGERGIQEYTDENTDRETKNRIKKQRNDVEKER